MSIDTNQARRFADGGDYYSGQEVRLWVYNLADEIDRLRQLLPCGSAARVGESYECHDGSVCIERDKARCRVSCARLGKQNAKPLP